MSSLAAQASEVPKRVLLIGAGGLGGPAAYTMAAARIGHLVIVDPDRVELSNLQRQVQYTMADIGRPKAVALAEELMRRGFPATRLEAVQAPLSAQNAQALLSGVDAAIEGSDDPTTKFVLNDAACAARVPFAIGGVERWQGHVVAVQPGKSGCYRCLFEDPPDAEQAPSCAAQGVLGATVAAVGGLLAQAALNLIQGEGESGQIVVLEHAAGHQPARRVRYNPRPDCRACQN